MKIKLNFEVDFTKEYALRHFQDEVSILGEDRKQDALRAIRQATIDSFTDEEIQKEIIEDFKCMVGFEDIENVQLEVEIEGSFDEEDSCN